MGQEEMKYDPEQGILYRVWDTDRKKWWNRFIQRNQFKSMWDSLESTRFALESAKVYHEEVPTNYLIKKCVVKVIQTIEEN